VWTPTSQNRTTRKIFCSSLNAMRFLEFLDTSNRLQTNKKLSYSVISKIKLDAACTKLFDIGNSRNRIAFRLEQNIEWIRETRDFENIFRPTKAYHQTTLQSRSDVTTVNEYDEIHFKLCCLMKKMRKNECGHQPRKTGKQGSYGTKGRNIGSFRPL
jgi:hypothetical protein